MGLIRLKKAQIDVNRVLINVAVTINSKSTVLLVNYSLRYILDKLTSFDHIY